MANLKGLSRTGVHFESESTKISLGEILPVVRLSRGLRLKFKSDYDDFKKVGDQSPKSINLSGDGGANAKLNSLKISVRDDDSVYFSSSKNAAERYDIFLASFRMVARNDVLEYGCVTRCDELVERWCDEMGESIGPVINYIFLHSIHDKRTALFLLKAIGSIPYHRLEPFGAVQAMAYFSMEDVELAEAGLRAFESWEHSSTVPLLEKVRMREEWLERYRLSIIKYLKGL
ncbi:hypothetical protein IFR09_16980 [Pseudomonas syringae]|nr:hypothetical protein [Pseudomonas syringae]MBD8802316.1 hypothetical protein [Pseudomonas syringae]MBD8812859.1 hypothetical protein [Pseudomonas syringae]